MKDAHDPREFRQWVSMDDLGNVIAVHEFAATDEQPLPEVVEVTKLGRKQDWNDADPAVLAPIRLEHQILVAETAAVLVRQSMREDEQAAELKRSAIVREAL